MFVRAVFLVNTACGLCIVIFHRRYLAEISASFKDILVLFMIFVGHTMIRNFCQLLQTEL